MPHHILPAAKSELLALASVVDKAYAQDPLLPQLLPHTTEADRFAFWAGFFEGDYHKDGEVLLKAVESATGEVVGLIKYRRPCPKKFAEHAESSFPPGADEDLLKHWFAGMHVSHEKNVNWEKDFFINVLGVVPTVRGQRVGRALMELVSREADAEGARCYLEATDMGRVLYRKLGYVGFESLYFDTPQGQVEWLCMRRQPGMVDAMA